MTIICIASIASLALNLIYYIYYQQVISSNMPLGWLGRHFLALLPGRYLNLTVYFFFPVLIIWLAKLWENIRLNTVLTLPLLLCVLFTAGKTIYSELAITRWGLLNGIYSIRRPVNEFDLAKTETTLLLTSPGTHVLPGIARRPVLLDPEGIDFIPYLPELADRTNQIAKEVYGCDLLRGQSAGGRLPVEIVRKTWEGRSRQEWERLSAVFGFKQVFTPKNWIISLDQKRNNDRWAIYDVEQSLNPNPGKSEGAE